MSHIKDTRETEQKDLTALAAAFQAFNVGAEKMRQMYAKLESRVAYLTEELERKNRELERANRLAALGELAAGVAHEIRNPLGGIEVCATLLHREIAPFDKKKELVANIIEGTRRINNIVTGLLTFARDNKIALREFNIIELISDTIDSVKTQAKENNVYISKKWDGEKYQIKGDADQLRQVFLNLILNAIEAMPGGGRLTVSVSRALEEKKDRRFLKISFTDTGMGIADKDIDKIFNPFFTTKEKGTGLGLAISYKIIELHKGRIEVQSREGKGSVFTVFLPC